MKFSVDMIRLQVRIFNDDFESFVNKFFADSPYVQSYQAQKFSDYRFNFIIHETINSNPFNTADSVNKFWLGYAHNSEQEGFKHNLVIEFNPNKCDIENGLLQRVLNTFYFSANMVLVRSVDVAIDLDVPITNFFVDKKRKNNYTDMFTSQGRTIYVGARGSDGRIKIYDKGAEQELTDVNWTRWEISIKFDNVQIEQILLGKFDFKFNVPDVFYFDDIDYNEFDVKMRCYIYSLLNGFVKLSDFSNGGGANGLRKKIKRTLEESASIKKIDEKIKTDVYNTIITYFTDFSSTFMILPDYIKNRQSDKPTIQSVPLAPIAQGKQLEIDYT